MLSAMHVLMKLLHSLVVMVVVLHVILTTTVIVVDLMEVLVVEIAVQIVVDTVFSIKHLVTSSSGAVIMAATLIVGTILILIRMYLNIVTASSKGHPQWLLIMLCVVEKVTVHLQNVFKVIVTIVVELAIRLVHAINSNMTCSSSSSSRRVVVLVPTKASR